MARIQTTPQADLGVIWEADRARYSPEDFAAMGVSKEMLIAYFTGCPTIGYQIDGVAAGGAIFDGEKMHIAVLPAYYGRWGLLVRPTLEWLFALKDPVQIHIEKHNERCLVFSERNDARRIGETEDCIILELSSQTNHVLKRHRERQQRCGHRMAEQGTSPEPCQAN